MWSYKHIIYITQSQFTTPSLLIVGENTLLNRIMFPVHWQPEYHSLLRYLKNEVCLRWSAIQKFSDYIMIIQQILHSKPSYMLNHNSEDLYKCSIKKFMSLESGFSSYLKLLINKIGDHINWHQTVKYVGHVYNYKMMSVFIGNRAINLRHLQWVLMSMIWNVGLMEWCNKLVGMEVHRALHTWEPKVEVSTLYSTV